MQRQVAAGTDSSIVPRVAVHSELSVLVEDYKLCRMVATRQTEGAQMGQPGVAVAARHSTKEMALAQVQDEASVLEGC